MGPVLPQAGRRELRRSWRLGAVGGAAALALAGVLALAALVAGLAAAGALAIVLAFTGVLGGRGLSWPVSITPALMALADVPLVPVVEALADWMVPPIMPVSAA